MGVKQRDVIKMTQEEIDEFLQGRRSMSIATMNHDDTIHLVAMWYGFLEGCPALETKTKSQKVQNLRRNDQYKETLIIALASEDEPNPEGLTEYGYSEAFKKPFDIALLAERIRALVEEKRDNL